MMKTTRYNARRKIVLLRERIEFIPRPKRTDLGIVRLGKKHFCRVIISNPLNRRTGPCLPRQKARFLLFVKNVTCLMKKRKPNDILVPRAQ